MKRKQPGIILITAMIILTSCNRVPYTGEAKLENQLDSLSYALGFYEATSWKQHFEKLPFDTIDYKYVALAFKNSELVDNYIDFRKNQLDTIDIEMFKKGFFNELAYDKSYFTDMTADIYIRKIFRQVKEKKDSVKNAEGRENLNKGQAFLEENAKQKGVVTLESGLQYQVLKEGSGRKPEKTDRVKCTYHGTLIDGTIFDSTVERGDTATFRVNRVIKGWQEALTMMPEGSEWKLFIPSNLAYGTNGAGDKIGPNETLIFDIELIEILEKQ
ncbi:MAG: FKBP-type peptidyl-prolyl cis-trans isomerase FklB [Anaerophaga sp.]|nr:FKBP-type peptidyl-prolyl cis-trans isomerase FklB [Anaerophaga sp.]